MRNLILPALALLIFGAACSDADCKAQIFKRNGADVDCVVCTTSRAAVFQGSVAVSCDWGPR